jgi:hypothetical protein
MTALTVLEHIAGRPLVRRMTDAVIGRYAVARTAALDRQSPARVQEGILLRLVRRGRKTRFGIDHHFASIRTVADYQARVPLREYEAFWKDYWQPAFPLLDDVSWPGRIPYLALSSGTASGVTKYIPISREMLASNRRAALTTLALFLAAHPGIPLFTGRLFFLGGSTSLQDLSEGRKTVLAGDLSGIVTQEASALLRPFTFPPLDLAMLNDWDEKLRRMADESLRVNITMLSGVPSWMLTLFHRLREVTGKQHIAEVWPRLRLIIHGGTRFDPYRRLFRELVGSARVHFTECYPASEGYIAAEDHRHGMLRLLIDHDVFFEFVPVEDLGSDRPARHTVANLETGLQYAVVLTTCAGLWSYVLGDTICFESRRPLLLRFTGRTRYFLSAFGEHLISEEIERAVAEAAAETNTAVIDFHVGPIFPETASQPGRHRYFVEFAAPVSPGTLVAFTQALDAGLNRLNEDYAAHRRGDLTMLAPEVVAVPMGGFTAWMRSRGRLGGQNKVPRMDNSGALTDQLRHFFAARHSHLS